MKFFKITHQDKKTKARTGIIHTDHGDIETPQFMPVGTQATVKTLDSSDLKNLDTQIILGNTYHLHLRPGENLIAKMGGLHKFMNWDKPILTDSGGFQVFSLGLQKEIKGQGNLTKIDNDGVNFSSHVDGSKHRFTPESAIKIQHKIGADIIMAFDECTPDDADEKYTKKAMNRTHDWAKKCLTKHEQLNQSTNKPYKQFLFGIIQGAQHKKLRQKSAKFISSLPFDGIAIGGESIGYNMKATKKILDWVNPIIPENKPHYTMGVGHNPKDLFEVVERGVDMFDCVSPTRVARNGRLFVNPKVDKKLYINILNTKYKTDAVPIDPTCNCPVCLSGVARGTRAKTDQNYSRAYLHHLFKAGELTAYRLATIHNVHFLLNLMKQMREAIKEDGFIKLKKEWT